MSPMQRPSATRRTSGIQRAVAQDVPQEPEREVPALPESRQTWLEQGRERTPEHVRPVRITVDLAPALHTFLRDYARQASAGGADVIRELIRQLRVDHELAMRVQEEIHRRKEALEEARRKVSE